MVLARVMVLACVMVLALVMALACGMSPWRGSHGLSARRARRSKSRGPKSLQLEVWVRRAPRLLVLLYCCFATNFVGGKAMQGLYWSQHLHKRVMGRLNYHNNNVILTAFLSNGCVHPKFSFIFTIQHYPEFLYFQSSELLMTFNVQKQFLHKICEKLQEGKVT